MKNRLTRALLLTLSLLICVLPVCAHAEEALPSADHLNMTSVSIRNIRYDDGSGEKELPLTFDLTMGADLPARRAMALVSINTGEEPLTFMGSIENEEIRARLSGIDAGIAIPLQQAEDALIKNVFLMGMEYDEISEETRAALDEYLVLLEESMSIPAKVIDSSDAVEAMYPLDEWREDYEKYPSLMNAVPAGEEEITLFGKTYTAKKYTYSMENATEEEFLAFYESYDAHFYGATGELDAAYEKLMELVWADLEALIEKNDVWKDDGSIEESESGSLSEWNEAEQQGYLYSMEGVIWQVDEVLGMLEEYTATTRGPEGEYTTVYSYSDMLTDGCMRSESTTTDTDPYYGYISSRTDSTTILADETGRILMEGMTLSGMEYPDDPDYSYATNLSWRSEMTEDRLLMTMTETAASPQYSQQVMSLTADFALGQEEETGLINRALGTMNMTTDLLGMTMSASMDMDMLISTLPEGTLLPMTGEAINPFEAGEEIMNQLMSDVEALLLRVFGAFVPAPETPPSVGGALLG